MRVEVITQDEQSERTARFRAIEPPVSRDDFEKAELAERGTALFFWYSRGGGFSWLCPGCARWHGGRIGNEPVSGWDEPRWVNYGTEDKPTLAPSLGCPGWRDGTCPEGHWWLRDGELEAA